MALSHRQVFRCRATGFEFCLLRPRRDLETRQVAEAVSDYGWRMTWYIAVLFGAIVTYMLSGSAWSFLLLLLL
jgi:hypothetical protein